MKSSMPRHLRQIEDLAALEAFIDLHIADPRLAIPLNELDLWAEEYRKFAPVHGRQSRVVRMERQLLQMGASVQAQADIRARKGQAYVEDVCGWIEVKRAYGKTYEVFHPGLAGLTPQECRVLELSWRYQTESGKPDFVRIAQAMTNARGESEMTRQGALQALRRARTKVQEHWRRVGLEEETGE